MKNKRNEKSAASATIIGGADGPTSIFWLQNSKHSLKDQARNCVYRWKKKAAMRKIKAGTHSLEEVCNYIKLRYHAHELPRNSHRYQSQYNEHLAAMACQHDEQTRARIEKLNKEVQKEITALQKNGEKPDSKEYQQVFCKMEHEMEMIQKDALKRAKDTISIDYHAYEIRIKRSLIIHVEMDLINDELSIGGNCDSNRRKQMQKIMQDIYLYYGVSKRDIEEKTKRYNELICQFI